MNTRTLDETTVRRGTFLYGGKVECDVRIIHSPIHFGSGDYEDPAEVQNDIERDTYYIQFGSTTDRGLFNTSLVSYPSIVEAMAGAAATPGIGCTVRWEEGATNEV